MVLTSISLPLSSNMSSRYYDTGFEQGKVPALRNAGTPDSIGGDAGHETQNTTDQKVVFRSDIELELERRIQDMYDDSRNSPVSDFFSEVLESSDDHDNWDANITRIARNLFNDLMQSKESWGRAWWDGVEKGVDGMMAFAEELVADWREERSV